MEYHFTVILYLVNFCIALGNAELPANISSNETSVCATGIDTINRLNNISAVLKDQVNSLFDGPPCKCGIRWSKVVDFDMSNTSQSCPSGWYQEESKVRGCRRSSGKCASAFFLTNFNYSRVCGQVIAIQYGTPDAFHYSLISNVNIEGPYIDGVSVTHGSPGSRKHIWSFVAANSAIGEVDSAVCSCSLVPWPYTTPAYVGNNYFCDSAQEASSFQYRFFSENPLWDGFGCSSNSACCEFNDPPWFCTSLPESTDDSIEVRICGNQNIGDENIIITRMELYIQ